MIRNYRRKVFRKSGKHLTPSVHSSADFFLVEFPKSGVTWLSVLLANLFLIRSGSSDRATFSSVRSYIPDLHVSNQSTAIPLGDGAVRFYKSHSEFNPAYIHTIYLARHPYDVMKSYHRYLTEQSVYAGSLEELCFRSDWGLVRWKKHVTSWLYHGMDTNQYFLHLIRYEDLVEQTHDEIAALGKNFGWCFEPSVIDSAVNSSERSIMCAQEKIYGSRNPNKLGRFVGEKASGGSEDDQELREKIDHVYSQELELLGYS